MTAIEKKYRLQSGNKVYNSLGRFQNFQACSHIQSLTKKITLAQFINFSEQGIKTFFSPLSLQGI